jgi:predicted HTH domain antitoxin
MRFSSQDRAKIALDCPSQVLFVNLKLGSTAEEGIIPAMIVDQQLDAVVRAGLFRDRQHAIHEAMLTFFAVRPQLRTEAAVELYRSGEISLLRAAEMAGLDFESFRLLLHDRGIPWEVEAESNTESERAIQEFFGGRRE